jgi:hypothetical protein
MFLQNQYAQEQDQVKHKGNSQNIMGNVLSKIIFYKINVYKKQKAILLPLIPWI